MNKFENVDVLAALEQIMRQNTAFYQNDFEIDKKIIREAAASDRAEDKALLWMSRPSGTYCFRERDVFLQDTRQYNTWKFYGEQTRDRILAYAVELTGTQGGTIRGNLYELDYPQHFRHVIAEAEKADNLILHYQDGDREQPAAQHFDGSPDPRLGVFLRYEAKPNEPDNLRELLRQEQAGRQKLQPGDLKAHVAALRDSLIMAEARRIVAGMKDLSEPNSPNKTHFIHAALSIPMLYRHERPARCLCRDRKGREPGQGGAAAPRLHPKAAIRNQTGPGPEKGPDQKQVKRIGGMKNVFYRGGRKPDLYVPQKRPAQDGGGCPGGYAGYGRGNAGAGPPDRRQARRHERRRL